MFNLFKNKKKNNIKINEAKLLKQYGKCNVLEKHINLLIISDTHGLLQYNEDLQQKLKNINNYDLCCALGDIYSNDYEIILKYIPREKIIAIIGNHDEFDILEKFNINNINGKIIEFNGIKIGGIQGSYKYKDTNFPSFTQEESIQFLNNMAKVDILLSHTGPYIGEVTNPVHNGLIGITNYLYKKQVPYNIHGHNHINEDSILLNGTKVYERYLIETINI